MAVDLNTLAHDPKNLATALVLAAALAQPRDIGRNGFQTALQRGVGTLAFRGEMEKGVSDVQREDRLEAERAAENARKLAAEEETARAQTAEVQARREATTSAAQTAQAEMANQLKLRQTPQALDPSQVEENKAHAQFYQDEGAWMLRRPDKDNLQDMLQLFPKTPEGSKALLTAVAGITSMVDPLQQGEILKSYYPIMGIHGITPFKDKTGRIGFNMPDELAAQIRGLGGNTPGVPPTPTPPAAAPKPAAPPAASITDILAQQQTANQNAQVNQQKQDVLNAQNAGMYRSERAKLQGLSMDQLNQLGQYSSQMHPVTSQAYADELVSRKASNPVYGLK